MTASERSFYGLAKQAVRGTPITDDAAFKYILFNQGSISPNNVVLPLDAEVGGGAMLRNMVKVGVTSQGALEFIPRPHTLGMFLLGATGRVDSRRYHTDVMSATSANGATVSTGFTQPVAPTYVYAGSGNGATGEVVVSGTVSGSPDTDTLTLTGVASVTGSKTFKTISKIELPGYSTGTTETIAVTETGGDPLLVATALTLSPQSITVGISNPSPAGAVKIIGTNGARGTIRVYGTDGSDASIVEEIYLYPMEYVKSAKQFSTITSVALPSAAGTTISLSVSSSVYDHKFFLNNFDQFEAPYWTVRGAPGNILGEQFQDMRFNALSLEMRAANFMRGTVGMVGGLPTTVSTATWNPQPKVDGGPQFLTPVATVELPTGTSVKVLSMSFSAGMAIPLDEQWIIGSYSPDDFAMTSRAFALSMNVKIDDANFYRKISYDPAGGSAWVAEIFREGRININVRSDKSIGDGVKYALSIRANGQAGDAANMAWSAAPIGVRAGRQIVMAVTGMFLADPTGERSPIEVELINGTTSY